MPRLGLGVWKIKNSKVTDIVSWALETGYRHIDTARSYGNEQGVGAALAKSGLPRNELFITTKLAVYDFHKPEKAFKDSLKRLKLDYVDLYLLHWPFWNWKKDWKVLEKIYKEGEAKAIGVSNFGIKELKIIKKLTNILPAVNQVELSPFLNRKKLVHYCKKEGIVVEAYSPLTQGIRLKEPILIQLAQKYKKSPAQIILRWGLQQNLVMIPKSKDKNHLKDNISVFNFEISQKDMQRLNLLNENYSTLFPGWSRG